jgi:MFS family permease
MSTSFHRIRGANAGNSDDELPSLYDMLCCCLKRAEAMADADKAVATEARKPPCRRCLRTCCGDVEVDPLAELEAAKRAKRRERYKILVGAWAVLFLRYCIATMIGPFFPQRATMDGISPTMLGLIFAAYPAGMAITSAFAGRLIIRMGTRTAAIAGLLLTAVTTVAFGFVPEMLPEGALQWGFLSVYFLTGLTGALAETAVITRASAAFRDDALGAVMASIGTVCGVGCMAGPPLGGQLSDIPGVSDEWLFRIPFIVFGFASMLLAAPVPWLFPREDSGAVRGASAWTAHDGATRSKIREQEAFYAGRSAGAGISSSAQGHNRARVATTGKSFAWGSSAGSFGSGLWSGDNRQMYTGFRSTGSKGSSVSSAYGSVAGAYALGEHEGEEGLGESSGGSGRASPSGGRVVDTTLYDTPSACEFTATLYGASDAGSGGAAAGADGSGAAGAGGWRSTVAAAATLPVESRSSSCGALMRMFTPSFSLSLFAIALNGTIVATLSPVLPYRIGEGTKLGMSSSAIGWMLSISSISYVLTSIPIGWLVDRFPGNSRVCKGVQGGGFVVLAAAFALIGPFTVPGAPDVLEPVAEKLRPSLTLVVVAMVLKGIGSSGNNAGFTDLVIGVPEDDEYLNALVAGCVSFCSRSGTVVLHSASSSGGSSPYSASCGVRALYLGACPSVLLGLWLTATRSSLAWLRLPASAPPFFEQPVERGVCSRMGRRPLRRGASLPALRRRLRELRIDGRDRWTCLRRSDGARNVLPVLPRKRAITRSGGCGGWRARHRRSERGGRLADERGKLRRRDGVRVRASRRERRCGRGRGLDACSGGVRVLFAHAARAVVAARFPEASANGERCARLLFLRHHGSARPPALRRDRAPSPLVDDAKSRARPWQ